MIEYFLISFDVIDKTNLKELDEVLSGHQLRKLSQNVLIVRFQYLKSNQNGIDELTKLLKVSLHKIIDNLIIFKIDTDFFAIPPDDNYKDNSVFLTNKELF